MLACAGKEKTMRSKKIMSFLLALVMMFAVAVPVMAEDREKFL